MQSVPQSIPAGVLVTVPCPLPDFVTVKTGLVVKVAVTDLERSIVRVHVRPLPVQAPLHPANAALPSGWAVSVTPVTDAYVSVQSVPQLIPAGLLVTVPFASPSTVTVRRGVSSSPIFQASDSAASRHAKSS